MSNTTVPAHTPQAHAVADATGWNLDADALEREWSAIGLGPVGQHRDSGTLERSNFTVVFADLAGQFGDAVDTATFGHWGFGWVEEIIWNAGRQDVADAVQAWRDALADYPVADEMQYSELEYAEALDTIPNLLPGNTRDDEGDYFELVDELPEGYAGEIYSAMGDAGQDVSPDSMREAAVIDAAFTLGYYVPEA